MTTRRQRDRALGRTLGKWVVEKRIGRGGMGDVFLARHTELGRPAAIKTLAPRYAESPEYVRRFRSEAAATSKLDHENIVDIYDVDATADLHYIVMEYIEGTSLQMLLKKKRFLDPHLAVQIARDVTKGILHAHLHGIVHRDIKPGNILLGSKNPRHGEKFRIVLTDFGLCQDPDADATIFEPGLILGTPFYISPEQARGERADDRSDLYSIGVTLYVMLTGVRPFDGRTMDEVLHKQLNKTPKPLLKVKKGLPMMLGRILNKALQKKRDRRYQIAAELIQDLDKFLKVRPRRSRPGKR